MPEQTTTKAPRKPLIRIVPATELRGTLCARDYVREQLGDELVLTKDDLKGFGPGGENW